MGRNRLFTFWQLVPLLWILAANAVAADKIEGTSFWDRLQGERLQIHGFASLTGLKTSANRFYGNSRNWSFDQPF